MIRILTTFYNSSKYISKCVKSIRMQDVEDWKCYITDDMSSQEERQAAQSVVEDDNKFEYIVNREKMYQPGNYWQILQIPEIDDNDICITIDGDDWLPDDPKVFDRVISYFSDNNTLLAFGQYLFFKGDNELHHGTTKKPVPFDVRRIGWTSSHLRMFKAHMFRRIKKEDIMRPGTNEFYRYGGDVVCFSPMIEMAGEDRVKYVKDINYIYNVESTINDFKIHLNEQSETAIEISKKPRYARI